MSNFKNYYMEEQANKYDSVRFSSRGGQIVNKVELDVINRFLAKEKKDSRILDVACGTGRLTYGLKMLGFNDVTGTDISDKMLSIAKSKNPDTKFVALDFLKEGNTLGNFDIITSLRFIHHLGYKDMKKVFAMVFEMLNHGGLFVFDTNNVSSLNMFTKIANLFNSFSYNQFTEESTVENILSDVGFNIRTKERRFFIPPVITRYTSLYVPITTFAGSTFWVASK